MKLKYDWQSKIMVATWNEPEMGSFAQVWALHPSTWKDVEAILAWVDEVHGDEVGQTIAKITIHETEAVGGDLKNDADAIANLAVTLRYSTGEGIYHEDCEIFTQYGEYRK